MDSLSISILTWPQSWQFKLGWLATACVAWAVLVSAQDAGAQDMGEQVTLDTKDGVKIACRYFASPKGESAVPVVLLHAWKGQGSELVPLAKFLNGAAAGRHAVIVPDLRGHGTSTVRTLPDGTISPKPLDAAKMRKEDFEDIVMQDLEAVKRFLLVEHNQRRLNIDMLSVVGIDLGALAGIYWTVNDWNWPVLAGGRRQGQDVKALVMISPPLGFKGVSMNSVLNHEAIRSGVAIQLLFGEKGRPAAAARRIHKTLGRESGIETGYDFRSFETKLQSTALFAEEAFQVDGLIASFIKAHVADHAEAMPWKPRDAKSEAEQPEAEKKK